MARKGKRSRMEHHEPMMRPRTMKERMDDHADMAARSAMEAHPLMKKMRSDMAKALRGAAKGVARGAGARSRGVKFE